jgi:hypothetical protein
VHIKSIPRGKRTGGDNVIDNDDLLARFDGVGLHLEKVLAVLLIVGLGFTWAGQLALLAHRHEAGAEAQGQARADQEAAGLKADDDIGLLAAVGFEEVQLQTAQEGLVEGRVGEDGEDILEENAGRREIGELTEGATQSYLKTGEFGGAGGSGGGLSGDLGGGIRSLRRGDRLGHGEERKGRSSGVKEGGGGVDKGEKKRD